MKVCSAELSFCLLLCRWNNLSLAYTETLGLPALRKEIADQYGKKVGPDNLVVLAPEEGIFLAMTAILRAGDHVVCTAPGEMSSFTSVLSLFASL